MLTVHFDFFGLFLNEKIKRGEKGLLNNNKKRTNKKKMKEVEMEEDKSSFLYIVAGDEAERGYKGTLKRK